MALELLPNSPLGNQMPRWVTSIVPSTRTDIIIISVLVDGTILVTQRGIWYPSGELGNSSKAIIEGNMEKNMTNKLMLLKNLTKVEFYEEDDEISRNIENCMTIALWEFF